jgi:branched-subunit amino acid aminotransferase/4-amino-4-deoxychorismate lyase
VFPAHEERAAVFAEGVALKKKKLPYKLEGETPKTTNYTRSILALREADSQGFYDVLWSNLDDEITEATTANIFFIGRHGSTYEISTPALQCGLLPGITRETILRLMRDAGVDVSEAVIYGNELPRYDEAFLCSTVRGLVPVERIDNQHFHTTRPNSIFHMIEAAYMKWVQLQLGFKVNWNTGERA